MNPKYSAIAVQRIFLPALFLTTCLLSCYNLFNGFGEDSDSLRIAEAARLSARQHVLIPSRCWGYPLYEAVSYTLLNAFYPSMLPAKLLSLILVLATLYLLFRSLLALSVAPGFAFLLCLLFIANPLIIIASNSLLETSMSLFFLMAALCYFCKNIQVRKFTRLDYLVYGVLFGLATLARPDNMLYFPAIFIFLIFRRELNIAHAVLSVVTFLTIGLLPFYLLHYPIFQTIATVKSYDVPAALKNILATFGIPMTAVITGGGILLLRKSPAVFRNALRWRNDVVRFTGILIFIVLMRVFKMADEIEYGIFLWGLFIVLLALVITEMAKRYSPWFVRLSLALLIASAFIPNAVEIYLFKEDGSQYRFSVGITAGVLRQEKSRRLLNAQILNSHEQILLAASNGIRDKDFKYQFCIHYAACDDCIVLVNPCEYKLYQNTIRAVGTDLTRHRIVYAPRFNISRGWRNFIKDNDMPLLTGDQLVLEF